MTRLMKALVLSPSQKTATVRHDVPIPKPKPVELLVEVHAVALNPVDALYVANPIADQEDRLVGSDFAGVVVEVGANLAESDDPRAKVGARVAGFVQGACSVNRLPGAFASYLAIPYDLTFLIPSSVTFASAATVPLCALTAAQALFSRLELPAPFLNSTSTASEAAPNALLSNTSDSSPPTTILIYGSSTSVALYAAQLLNHISHQRPVRIVGAASKARHPFFLAPPYSYSHLVDYRDQDWPAQVRAVTPGEKGADLAFDCISEGESVRFVSSTLRKDSRDGKIAVVRSREGQAWDARDVEAETLYGAVWEGLGEEVQYQGMHLAASPPARAFAVEFYRWLTDNTDDQLKLESNPVRIMPGSLERIVPDGFALLSPTMEDREKGRRARTEEYMRPISAEKLVYLLERG